MTQIRSGKTRKLMEAKESIHTLDTTFWRQNAAFVDTDANSDQ